jgi:hypothetical protein
MTLFGSRSPLGPEQKEEAMRGVVFTSQRGQTFNSAIALAALVGAVSFASSTGFAQSGREAGSGRAATVTTATPVNKPAATPKIDKSSSNLLKNTATGKHLQKTQ